MIRLTRLNHQPIIINSDLIKFVESTHDTVLTLLDGEKILVCETPSEVIERIIAFRRTLLAGLPLASSPLENGAIYPSLSTANHECVREDENSG